MITAAEFTNVCRIDYLYLEFDALFRVEGPNGAGKTKVVYDGLELVLYNKPFPDSYVRRGERSASIKIIFDDGRWITRERIGAKQKLTLFDPVTNETKSYDTIKDMTEQVRRFTGFNELVFDKTKSENYQFIPIEAPQTYLIHNAPEVVLRTITKVIGGQGAEVAKQKLTTEHKALKVEATVYQQQFDAASIRVGTDWEAVDFDDLGARYKALTDISARIDGHKSAKVRVEDKLSKLDTVGALVVGVEAVCDLNTVQVSLNRLLTLNQVTIQQHAKKVSVSTALLQLAKVKAVKAAVDFTKLADACTSLALKATHIEQNKANKLKIENKLDALMRLDGSAVEAAEPLAQAEERLTQLNLLAEKLAKARERKETIGMKLKTLGNTQGHVDEWARQITVLEHACAEAAKAQPVCETCGRPLELAA